GLARLADSQAEGITRTGQALGTPAYMAPEQAMGQRVLAAATDVYGLGATLYALLAGRPPFGGKAVLGGLRAVTAAEPPPLRELNARVPRDLETICLKCLHKDPRQRYPTAAALADDLRHFLDHQPIRARPAGPLDRPRRWTRRNPLAAALLVALI